MTPSGHAWTGHFRFGLKVYHLPISQGDMVYIEVQSWLPTWNIVRLQEETQMHREYSILSCRGLISIQLGCTMWQ